MTARTWKSLVRSLAIMMLLMPHVQGAEIRVMISEGFFAAYSELVPQFERTTGHKVITARGASVGTGLNSIPSRVQRGEPGDLVVMTGSALDRLIQNGKVAAGTRVDLGTTR